MTAQLNIKTKMQKNTFYIVPVFSHAFFEFPTCHPNIFTHRVVLTVFFDALPVIYTVDSFTVNRLGYGVCVTICLTGKFTVIR